MSVTPLRTAAAIAVGLVLSAIILPTAAVAETASNLPVKVTIVVPMSVPEGKTGLISADALASYTSPTGLLTRQLDAVSGTPAAIGVDPMILVSIRILGNTAPPSATAWLDALAASGNETFALSYADSDLTTPLQAGSASVLEPQSFDFAVDAALFTPAPSPTSTPTTSPTPSATPDAGALPPYPTTESLLGWNWSIAGLAWPADGTVTSADLSALDAAGYSSTIVTSQNVSLGSRSSASVETGTSHLLVADSSLTAQFNLAAGSGTGDAWQADLATLATGLAAVPSSSGSRPGSVLLPLNRGSLDPGSHLRATILSIDAAAATDLYPLSALDATAAADAALTDLPQTPERISTVRALLAAEAADATFSTVASDPERITSDRRIELLAVLSNAWDRNPGGWLSATGDYLEQSTTTQQSVRIVKSSSINLFGDRGALPVIVQNDLDQPATVYVTVRPLSPLIAVDDPLFEITLEPFSQRVARIPVQSLSNGSVSLEVSLSSATSAPIGPTTYVRTNVQAGWEGPVTIVIGILVFVAFAFGIYRTVLKRRRARAEPGDDNPGDVPGDGAPTAALDAAPVRPAITAGDDE